MFHLDRHSQFLRITEEQIRLAASKRFSGDSLAAIVARQAFTEHWLRMRKHLNFRSNRNDAATAAYCAMSADEFEGINARQNWANWRTIPRNLNGRIPDRPIRAIDLCCGLGHSTEVLAYFLPKGSEILGLEYNPRFVALARERDYRARGGDRAIVRFRAQSVLETFAAPDGKAVEGGSIDLVNCCGAVGSHFSPNATEKLAGEIVRVLAPGAIAALDAGPDGTSRKELIAIFQRLGFRELNTAKSCLLDQFPQVCFRRELAN